MRLAVSNIAWDRPEDESVAALLARHEVDAIDLVPAKYFGDPVLADDSAVRSVKRWWADRGIAITGMQALMFGTSGMNVFGPAPSREAMLRHLGALCRVAGGLEATRLVFGSPRNRDRGGLDDDAAADIAAAFFRALGDIAAACGVMVCLEPNPVRYGANFMTTSADTARAVMQINHPAIRMQFDTGSLAINAEDPFDVMRASAPSIGHVHASEPDLVPLGDGGTDHAEMAAALATFLPGHVVSIEMLATKSELHTASIERALGVAIRHYRDAAARVSA